MSWFSRRKATSTPKVVALVHLNSRLQPMHRGSVFEDTLHFLLQNRAPGSAVIGGGTEFTPETGPLSCDIEVEIGGDLEQTLALIVKSLERLGAPVGSWIQVGEDAPLSFGVTHGLALSLDGTSLPDDVYAQNDVNELVDALTSELRDSADLHSRWEGRLRTNLYFYARDVDRLRSVLESAAGRFPLAQRSTVEPITD